VTDGKAFFTPEQVMEALDQAPEVFTLQARNPSYDMTVGGDQVHYAPGYGCAAICRPDGCRRDAVMADYIRFAKLVHQSPHFRINGGILAHPSDVPAQMSHLLMIYAALLSSDKCLLGIPGNRVQMQAVMELASIAFGGREAFAARPHLLTLINTLSPLQIDETTLDAMLVAASHRQPLIISPSPAAGTTGPIDLAANISLATAEALAAIAIVQLIYPGTPVLFGLMCLGADLRTGNVAYGSPAFSLQARYTAALARRYRLPSRFGGTLTDAPSLSVQCGYESMLNLLSNVQNGVNLVAHSAGTLNSVSAMSYEKFIMDLEIIDMVRYYCNDLPVDSDTLDLELIREIGPGGLFLSSRDTLKKCRTRGWDASVGVRNRNGEGEQQERFYRRIADRQRMLLEAYSNAPPAIAPSVAAELERYLQDQGLERGLLETIRRLVARVDTSGIHGKEQS
jgi:trimethylamine--corrinoid protein Co-methyltransferase